MWFGSQTQDSFKLGILRARRLVSFRFVSFRFVGFDAGRPLVGDAFLTQQMSRCLQARAPRDKDSNSYIKIFAKIEWKDIQAKIHRKSKSHYLQEKSSIFLLFTPKIDVIFFLELLERSTKTLRPSFFEPHPLANGERGSPSSPPLTPAPHSLY